MSRILLPASGITVIPEVARGVTQLLGEVLADQVEKTAKKHVDRIRQRRKENFDIQTGEEKRKSSAKEKSRAKRKARTTGKRKKITTKKRPVSPKKTRRNKPKRSAKSRNSVFGDPNNIFG